MEALDIVSAMMKYFIVVVLWICTAAIAIQPHKKAIVLIDGIAFVVEVSQKGAILARYKVLEDYFESNLSDADIIATVDPNIVIDRNVIDFYLDEETDVDGSADPKPPIATRSQSEEFTTNQYVSFALNRAVLNTQAVIQIRKISQSYVSGQIKDIEILSFHTGDRTTSLLAQNRTKAISDLLQTFGVRERDISIKIEIAQAEANLAFVNISLSKTN